MKKLAILAVVLCGVIGVALTTPVMAGNPWSEKTCEILQKQGKQNTPEWTAAGCNSSRGERGLYETAANVIGIISGIGVMVSVIMLVIGGMNFSTSAGDPGKVTKARKTILFSVIGLIVSLLAWAMVNFVLQNAR